MIDKLLVEFVLAYLIEHKTVIIQGLIAIAFALWERYLGKTDKFKSGSTLEMIELTIKKVIKK